MASIAVDGNDLVVRLSVLEKIGALRGNIRFPLARVLAVRVSDTPWSEVRGMRIGTGFPGVISLGTHLGPGIHDFTAVYGWRPALVVVEMTGVPFTRLVLSCANAAEAAARAADITRASGLAQR